MKGRKGIREEKNDDYVISEARKLGHEQNIEFSVFAGQLFSALDHEVLEEGFINSKADAENEREGAVSSMRRG